MEEALRQEDGPESAFIQEGRGACICAVGGWVWVYVCLCVCACVRPFPVRLCAIGGPECHGVDGVPTPLSLTHTLIHPFINTHTLTHPTPFPTPPKQQNTGEIKLKRSAASYYASLPSLGLLEGGTIPPFVYAVGKGECPFFEVGGHVWMWLCGQGGVPFLLR